jgi:hypothetical protein
MGCLSLEKFSIDLFDFLMNSSFACARWYSSAILTFDV